MATPEPETLSIMAKTFDCKTKSQLGNLILGILFLLCGLLLVSIPCFGLAGTLVGSVTLPKDSHEALGTLFALGVCMVLAVILLGERPTRINWLGIALVVFGAYLATARKAPADVGKGMGPQSATTIGAVDAAPVDSGAKGGGASP